MNLASQTEIPIRINLLGTQRVTVNGERVDTRFSARAFLVFAALVVRAGELLNREEIAFTLWPDVPELEARATLRRQLYNIQRALPPRNEPLIACNVKTIAWLADPEVYVDVHEFERLSKTRDGIKDAVALYGGDFAPWLDHDWIRNVRDRLHRQACQLLDQLILQCHMENDEALLRSYLEQSLGLDPWREDSVRKFMLLRFSAGDRAGALCYFRDFAQRLRREFQVEPMPETIKCFQSIAAGESVCIE
jgi:DNA-binding SARP family transcriptional activator